MWFRNCADRRGKRRKAVSWKLAITWAAPEGLRGVSTMNPTSRGGGEAKACDNRQIGHVSEQTE